MILLGVPSQTKVPLWYYSAADAIIQPLLRSRMYVKDEGMFWGGGWPSLNPNPIILESEAYPLEDERGALVKQARQWLSLPDGWNEEGSKAPTRAAFEALMQLIEVLPLDVRLPKLMLTDKGTLGIYWDLPEEYIDIEFEDDGLFSFFKRNKTMGIEEFHEGWTMSNSLHTLLRAMNYKENFAFAS